MTAKSWLALSWGVLATAGICLVSGYKIGTANQRHFDTALIAEKTAEIQDMGQRLDAANFLIPKSTSKKRAEQMATDLFPYTSAPDADNILKILDVLKPFAEGGKKCH